MNKVEELTANYSIEELEEALVSLVESRKYKHVKSITSEKIIGNFCKAYLANAKVEKFVAIFCNNQNEILHVRTMSVGTLDSCSIYPRHIVEKALEFNAAAMFIAHNHPSGSDRFSEQDIRITSEIKKSLNLFGIRLLDHILVCKNDKDELVYKSLSSTHNYIF